MPTTRPVFLSAEWKYLAMLNYRVPPELLAPHVPPGTEVDVWQGEALVSVVGFLFHNTRVWGLQWPWHTNFEEVNLRLYVRRYEDGQWKRGVAFVSEIVPRPAIAWIANALYNEHYRYMPTRHHLQHSAEALQVDYCWKYRGLWNSMEITADPVAVPIAEGSDAEFIFEHYWGYNQLNHHSTIGYQVQHPRWLHYPVRQWQLQLDVAGIYGEAWVPWLSAAPHSVMLAQGSAVTVHRPVKWRHPAA